MYTVPAKFEREWYEVALKYRLAPSFIDTPGRDLTQEQARDIVMHLLVHRQIELLSPALFDAKGVRIPKPGEHFKIANSLGGIAFKHPTLDWNYLPNVDLAWIVVLYRMAVKMFMEFGTETIYWGGIGIGRDDKPGDSHNTGRALDFFGAHTRKGTLWVTKDWSKRPIVVNGKTHKTWPASQIPFYRLQQGDPGFELFAWVYRFAAQECQDSSEGRTIAGQSSSTIGQRSFIIHPDHLSVELRKHHQDHMHFQIGTT
jgi:hypothetical protein